MTVRHTFQPGIELNEQERQNVALRVRAQGKSARPFAQVLEDQRDWTETHKPFDTMIRLPLTQYVVIGSPEHKAMAGVLVPLRDPEIKSLHPAQYQLMEHAHKQLLTQLGYDQKLYEKLPDKLNIFNLNWLIQNYYDKTVMLRCQDVDQVRGLMSEKYEPFDTLELLEAVEPYMKDAQTRWDYGDPEVMHLSLTFPRTEEVLRVGDVVQTGLHISNSEVGMRSVTIASYVYRLRCSNGAIGGAEDGGFFRFRHTGDSDNLRDRVKAAVESAYMNATKIVAEFKASLDKAINQPFEYIEGIAQGKANNMTQEDFKKVLDAFAAEPENSLYGVTNAFTRAAQDYDGEKSYEMQRLGYRVLTQGLGK